MKIRVKGISGTTTYEVLYPIKDYFTGDLSYVLNVNGEKRVIYNHDCEVVKNNVKYENLQK